jgi:hypothetical protein
MLPVSIHLVKIPPPEVGMDQVELGLGILFILDLEVVNG